MNDQKWVWRPHIPTRTEGTTALSRGPSPVHRKKNVNMKVICVRDGGDDKLTGSIARRAEELDRLSTL